MPGNGAAIGNHPLQCRDRRDFELGQRDLRVTRVQGCPDYFDFASAANRGALSTMIGNAAPPQLGDALIGTVIGHATLDMVRAGC